MLKKDDIILIKSYGNEKTKIFLRGVNEVLMIDASFEEVKFAINNDLQDLQGMQAVSAPLKIATWFLVRALNIYHNIRCVHRLKRAQRVFAPSATKSKSYPLKTPQNRADEFYGYELLCTRLAGGRFHPEFTPDNSKPAPNPTENGERGRNLLRGREALPAQPENPFSARSGRGSMYEWFRERIWGNPVVTL